MARRPHVRLNEVTRRNDVLQVAGRSAQPWLENNGALVRLARRYAGPDDWQDLLQDMQLQLWRSFDAFDGRAQRSTWLYRVALNTALSHVRKPRREH